VSEDLSARDLVRAFRENAAGLRAMLANVAGQLPSTWNGNTRNAIELRQSRLLEPIHALRKLGYRAAADALLDEHWLLSERDAGRPVLEFKLQRCLDEVALALQDDRRRGFNREDILAIGGRPWRNWRHGSQRDRVYLPDWVWMAWAGLDVVGDGHERADMRVPSTWERCSVDGAPVSRTVMASLLDAKVFWENGVIKSTVAEVFSAQGFDGAAHQARVLTGIGEAVKKRKATS
jgi:hypothetical protein